MNYTLVPGWNKITVKTSNASTPTSVATTIQTTSGTFPTDLWVLLPE